MRLSSGRGGGAEAGRAILLDTPMVIENLLGQLNDRPWWKAGDVRLLVVNHYDHPRERLDIDTRSRERPDGNAPGDAPRVQLSRAAGLIQLPVSPSNPPRPGRATHTWSRSSRREREGETVVAQGFSPADPPVNP